MSANSEILGNKGTKHSFDFEGKVYEVRYLDKKIKDAFEKNMFKRARDLEAIMYDDGNGDVSLEQYQQNLLAINDKFLRGDYAFESENGQAFLVTPAGNLYFTSLMCGCSQEEMIRILTVKGTEVASLLKLVLEESFPQVKKGKNPKNAKTPAA